MDASEDEKRTMAVINLQAMLNIEDMGKIYELLEQNNWDETQAASTFFAQQMQNTGGPPREEEAEGVQVRAPIQQQEDQLIGNPFADFVQHRQRPNSTTNNRAHHHDRMEGVDHDPFLRRAQTERVLRPRIPRPQDFTFHCDINYDEDDIAANEEEALEMAQNRQIREAQAQRQGWLRSMVSFFTHTFWYILTLGGSIAPTGYEQQDFGCGDAIANDDRLLSSLDVPRHLQFFKMCHNSRIQKKPLLLLVLSNPDDVSQIDFVVRHIAESQPVVQHFLNQKFNLFVISQEQMDEQLKRANEFFKLRPGDDINFFVLFTKMDAQIQVVQRIGQNQISNTDEFQLALQECSNLFDFMAEEDLGYRQIQLLQDAGVLPVDHHQQEGDAEYRRGGIQQQNIAQEHLDFMMREHPVDHEDAGQLRHQNFEFDRQDFSRNPAIPDPRMRSSHGNDGMTKFTEPARPQRPQAENESLLNADPSPEKEDPTPAVAFPDVVLPEEPAVGDADSLEIVMRMPVTGERVKRRFLKSNTVQVLYDFVDHLQKEGQCHFEGFENQYTDQFQVLQTFPRKIYSTKEMSLEEAGLWPRGGTLQIQQLTPDDE